MSERGEYCYGKYNGTHRFAMDQVPGQVNVSNQTLNDIGTGECFLIGAKQDMRSRQCTYQVCVWAEKRWTIRSSSFDLQEQNSHWG